MSRRKERWIILGRDGISIKVMEAIRIVINLHDLKADVNGEYPIDTLKKKLCTLILIFI